MSLYRDLTAFTPGRFSISGAAWHPLAAGLFSRMTAAATQPRKRLINDAIVKLDRAGILQKLDMFYMLAAHDAQAARLNWVSSSFTLGLEGTPTFLADRYYAGDGAAAGLFPNVAWNALTRLTLDSQSFGGWIVGGTDAANSGAYLFGQTSGSGANSLRPRSTGDVLVAEMGTTVDSSLGTNATIIGHVTAVRSAADAMQGYKNGAEIGTDNDASNALSSSGVRLLKHASSYSDLQVAMAYVGGALTAGDVASLHSISGAYLTAIGAV